MENNSNTILVMGAILIVALVIGVINVRNLNEDIEKLTERVETLEKRNTGTGSGNNEVADTYDTTPFKEISITELDKESKKETIVVWLGLPTCGYCKAYAPLLAEVAEEFGITARYVDVSKMTQEDYDYLVTLEGDGDYKGYGASFTGTPFTMIIKKGRVVGGIDGYVEADRIEAVLENAGLEK